MVDLIRSAERLIENGFLNLAEQQLRSIEPPTPMARALLGSCLEDLARYDEAADEYEASWRAGYTAVGNNMSSLLVSLDQFGRLRELLKDAESNGVLIPTLRLQGTLDEDLGDFESAEAWYRRAATCGDQLVFSSLGAMLCEQGRIEEGRELLLRGAGYGDWRAIERLASIDAGPPESTQAVLFELVESGHGYALLALAKALAATDASSKAEAALLDAVNEDVSGAAEYLLEHYFLNGRLATVRELLESGELSLSDQDATRWRRLTGLD